MAQQPCFESGDGSSDMTIPVVVRYVLVRRCGNRIMALTRLTAVAVLAALLWSANPEAVGALASVSGTAATSLSQHASVQTALEPQLGEIQIFFAEDWDNQVVIQIKGVVRAVGQHCIVYVQEGRAFPDVLLQDLVSEYDTNVHPRVTAALGAIPDPGVDGESRVVIFLYGFNDPRIMGSFFRGDLLPEGSTALSPSAMANSNHRDMFYLNLDAILLQPGKAAPTAAHELAHLIVFYRDFMLDSSPRRSEEDRWVQEGLAVYAELAAGYPERVWPYLLSFQMSPDKNLTRWPDVGVSNSDYGASYAFITYLVDRLGVDFPGQLVSETRDGISGISAVLAARGAFDTFATLFDDWVVADFLDSRPPALWPYYYQQIHVLAHPLILPGPLPIVGSGRVQNYGAVYLELPAMEADATTTVHAVLDGDDAAPVRAALLSWDSTGLRQPTVTFLQLAPATAGGSAVSPSGYDRHTLAVWSRGVEGATQSFGFRYTLAVDPAGGIQFLDVGADHQFFASIQDLLTRGIISGKEIPAGSGLWHFGPDNPVLRAQFAKMMVLSLGLPVSEGGTAIPFTDVERPNNDLYPDDYVAVAAANGLVNGKGNGRFEPYADMTRTQLLSIVVRAAERFKPAALTIPPIGWKGELPAGDPTHGANIARAEYSGLLAGIDLSGFAIWGKATRGEVAQVLWNLRGK
jgi:hypothetical protein